MKKDMNDRTMRKLGVSRRELFETIERDALIALPADDWEFAEWRSARVNLDYHVEVHAPYPTGRLGRPDRLRRLRKWPSDEGGASGRPLEGPGAIRQPPNEKLAVLDTDRCSPLS